MGVISYKDPNTGEYIPIPVFRGAPGIGIKSIEQTVTSTEDGGENIVTVTLTDGNKAEFVVRNGGSNINVESVPDYVRSEAERVAKAVQGIRTGKSLTVIHVSDVHHGATDTNTQKSLIMAGQVIGELRKLMSIDGFVCHGDNTAADGDYTIMQCKKDWTAVNDALCGKLFGLPGAWIPGNHEINYSAGRSRTATEDELYAYVGSNSVGIVRDVDHPEKNYGYIDYPNQRIRMIFLNTADSLTEFTPVDGEKAKSEWISAVQLQWFASTALDFSSKTDPAKWHIVVCSHHPLNYGEAMKRACAILEAYRDGTSGSITYADGNGVSHTVTYDFTTGAKAEIICNVHGHSHNFGYKWISSGNAVDAWLLRICIPCTNVGRENEHATNADLKDAYGEFDTEGNPVYHRKAYWSDADYAWIWKANEEGTNFNVLTFDPENGYVYAHNVGAGQSGADRVIKYKEIGAVDAPDEPAYTNLVPTSEALDSTAVYNGGLGYKSGTYISSSGGGDSSKAGHVTTGMIPYTVASSTTPETIYIKGGTPDRIGYYLSDKSFKICYNAATLVAWTVEELDTDYWKLTPVMESSGNSNIYVNHGAGGYLRFDCVCSDGASLIVTLNEPIE
jgi:hypothetical protein